MQESNEKRTALVAGASGLCGLYVVKALLRDPLYEKVIIFVRKTIELEHKKLQQVPIRFKDIQRYESYFEVDDIFCCLGTTIKNAGSKKKFSEVDYTYPVEMARIGNNHEVKRFVLISSTRANSNSNNFYLNTKGMLEETLMTFDFKHLIIVRPSLLLGKRTEFRLGERAAIAFSRLFAFLMLGSLRKYRPISAKHVAWCMVYLAKNSSKKVKVVESDELQSLYDIHHY